MLRAFGATALVAGAASLAACATTSPQRPWSPRTPLRIPELIDASAGPIRLEAAPGRTELRPGTTTETWGVNGAFLGPTLRLRTGDPVELEVRNALPETTTMHWHGMHVPAEFDGGPHQPIAPGETWRPSWTVRNRAATLWYHPHTHGSTAMHVFHGVAGMIIVDDADADSRGLPAEYGVDDLPCILIDRTIGDDGSMPFDTEPNFGQMGDEVLVNGTLGAYADLARTRVRLRLLNASNARRYLLELEDGREMDLIAADEGLLAAPQRLRRVALGPAERAEVVIEGAPGERLRLVSRAGVERIDGDELAILELRIRPDAAPAPAPMPTQLGGPPPLAPAPGATARSFRLQGHDSINDAVMDLARIDEVIPAGALEIWTIENTVYAHNFHIHGCEFTILDRDGAPPEPWEGGRKDTVHLPERSRVRLAVQFGDDVDPRHPFMYHCHILRHEDAGMMGQFVVVEPGTEAATPRTLAEAGHHG